VIWGNTDTCATTPTGYHVVACPGSFPPALPCVQCDTGTVHRQRRPAAVDSTSLDVLQPRRARSQM